MPIKGQTITNSTTGDSFEFLETAASTNGERVTIKATIKNKGRYVPTHYHAFQDETFEVLDGKLTVLLDGKLHTLVAGKKISLPKNIPHNHYNNDDTSLTYIHTVTPALDFDFLVENLAGLSADGKSKNGNYGIVQQLVTLKYIDSKSYLADVPRGIQNLLMNTIAPIGRLLGYRAIYKKYSGIEK